MHLNASCCTCMQYVQELASVRPFNRTKKVPIAVGTFLLEDILSGDDRLHRAHDRVQVLRLKERERQSLCP
jgi:hypothetical protein